MQRIFGIGLIVLGAVLLYERAAWWAPCANGPEVRDGFQWANDACRAAMNTSPAEIAWAGWLGAALAVLHLVLARGVRWRWVPLAVIVLVNPITDPGFIWQWGYAPFADATPGYGVLAASALILAGILALVTPKRVSRRAGEPEPSAPSRALASV